MDFSLSLRNDPSELARLASWIEEIKGSAGLSDRDQFRIDLSLAEAVANVIDHAGITDSNATIEIRAKVDPAAVTMVVVDPGPAFDPLAHAEKTLPTNLEDAEPGGLGIRLIRKNADSCAYELRDNANHLTLIFNRNQA